MDSLKVNSLLTPTTHLSAHINSPFDLGSNVSLLIYAGLLLELDQFLFLTLEFLHID